jgi:hypothetical protein
MALSLTRLRLRDRCLEGSLIALASLVSLMATAWFELEIDWPFRRLAQVVVELGLIGRRLRCLASPL